MPDHLQSFQLDFLTPELFGKIVKKAVTKGIPLPGHHGNYINFHMGDMILVIRTTFDPEKGLDYITGFDSHAKGCCVWDCEIESEKENEDVTAKTLRIRKNGAVFPLPLINGDILPAYTPGSTFKAQVAAYPETIAFYEEKPAESNSAEPWNRITPVKEDRVLLRGEAFGFRRGETTYMGGVLTRFLVGLINTEQGEIEMVFPDKLIPEGQEEMLHPGVFVEITGELAANPAIFDLEKGVPQQEENHE